VGQALTGLDGTERATHSTNRPSRLAAVSAKALDHHLVMVLLSDAA